METIIDNYKIWLNFSQMPENKRRILEATIKLYSEQGISGTSTSQIAKEAGFSKALFFKFFSSKDDLTMELIEPLISHVLPSFTFDFFKNSKTDMDLKSVISYIVYNRYQFLENNKELILVFCSEFLVNEKLRKIFIDYIEKNNKKFSSVISSTLVDNPELDNVISKRTFIYSMVSQILMFFLENHLFGKELDLKDKNRRLDEIVTLIYKGVKL